MCLDGFIIRATIKSWLVVSDTGARARRSACRRIRTRGWMRDWDAGGAVTHSPVSRGWLWRLGSCCCGSDVSASYNQADNMSIKAGSEAGNPPALLLCTGANTKLPHEGALREPTWSLWASPPSCYCSWLSALCCTVRPLMGARSSLATKSSCALLDGEKKNLASALAGEMLQVSPSTCSYVLWGKRMASFCDQNYRWLFISFSLCVKWPK